MSIIAFALAALAAGAAALLWRLDARQRTADRSEPAPATETFPEEAPVNAAVEPEPMREPVAEPEPVAVVEPESTGEETTEPEAPAPPPPVPTAVPERRTGLTLPGSLRRERRSWAEDKGFEFSRSDDWLNDEWSRGAAASGAAAKDIVSGQAFGHEMVLMDLGGVNVMAVRRGAASDVVIDARRVGTPEQESSPDLIEAFTLEDFRVLATDTGVAERLVDERVTTAFGQLPAIVTAVWLESDWVLAQTGRGSHSGDWEQMLAPLALLADAARALPPRTTATHVLQLDGMDPTRQMADPPKPGFGVLELVAGGAEVGERPLVQRPEEPLDMPSRRLPVARGVVEPSTVGADEVAPIADGSHRDHPRGVQMPRDLRRGPSIFGDGPKA
ncbi:hypothetical protein EAH68_03300 [Corynebacterium hylobatis]|uniref:Secreted protein n=1 Tax=Corynebacterium hylobatis TaxID=1859290 RepID=A0A3S0A0N7_9CORY|nr:hypothetical protein [Corynebacterium hylobatis]RSZ64642.1 hypothetical protein EAH68_03300 [Corynebacterium hylobatis]